MLICVHVSIVLPTSDLTNSGVLCHHIFVRLHVLSDLHLEFGLYTPEPV